MIVAMTGTAYQNTNASQRLSNGIFHSWYRTVLAFPDHLVEFALDSWGVHERSNGLDPFCGSGTTLIECQKRSLETVGIDANPVSVFASRVKTIGN